MRFAILFSDESAAKDGRILFKKPTKRPNQTDLNVSSKKLKDDKKRAKTSKSVGVNNKKLLSFGDDDEES